MELQRRREEEKIRYYKPHKIQKKFHKSKKRNRWFYGANSSGKSWAGAAEAVWLSTGTHPYRDIQTPNLGWVVGVDFPSLRDSAEPTLFNWMPRNMIQKWDYSNHVLYLKNGSVIGFKSADSGREKFQGAARDWVWIDEEIPYDIYEEIFMRVLRRKGDIWGTMTPVNGLSWGYDKIYRNELNDPEVECFVASIYDNKANLSMEEIKRAENIFSLDEAERDIRLYGKFRSRTGRIVPNYSEENRIERFSIPSGWNVWKAIDPHTRRPFSALWMAVSPENVLYFCDELSVEGKTTKEWAELVRKKDEKYGGTERSFIDPRGGAVRSASTGTTIQEDLARYGVATEPANTDVNTGIQMMREAFAEDEHGEIKTFVFNDLVIFDKQLKNWVWEDWFHRKDVDKKEVPRKKDDHMPDCARYMLIEEPSYLDPKKFEAALKRGADFGSNPYGGY